MRVHDKIISTDGWRIPSLLLNICKEEEGKVVCAASREPMNGAESPPLDIFSFRTVNFSHNKEKCCLKFLQPFPVLSFECYLLYKAMSFFTFWPHFSQCYWLYYKNRQRLLTKKCHLKHRFDGSSPKMLPKVLLGNNFHMLDNSVTKSKIYCSTLKDNISISFFSFEIEYEENRLVLILVLHRLDQSKLLNWILENFIIWLDC